MAEVAMPPAASLPTDTTSSPQIPPETLLTLRKSAKRTRELFSTPDSEDFLARTSTNADDESLASKVAVTSRLRNEYEYVRELPSHLAEKHANAVAAAAARRKKAKQDKEAQESGNQTLKMIEGIPSSSKTNGDSTALTLRSNVENIPGFGMGKATNGLANQSLARYRAVQQPKPDWHAPWKLMRVISGHLGWVRALAVEPGNQWFASGAGDRTIKIWDLATGNLKLTLTGHISTVRGLAVSPRHPYLFSCGEDKMVKCWDLETNKVIRHYHGHLSGVYTLDLHPELDVLVTGGRDGVARVWDMRTRVNVHVLSGHRGTVSDLKCQEADPQVITSSLDAQVRLWDLAAGKTMSVLTHHKKGVRALTVHPREFTFASASTGSIKQWKCPEGAFMGNFDGQSSIINTLAVNDSNVLFSGGDDGSISFWDWKTGFRFQNTETTAQPGSLEAESGIFSSTFDKSGLRLITGEADKTIKVWKEDTEATPDSHPLDWKPTLSRERY